jgi:hypothetical protein
MTSVQVETTPRSLKLGAGLQMTVIFAARPLHPRGKSCQWALMEPPGGGLVGLKRNKFLAPVANQFRVLSSPNITSLYRLSYLDYTVINSMMLRNFKVRADTHPIVCL